MRRSIRDNDDPRYDLHDWEHMKTVQHQGQDKRVPGVRLYTFDDWRCSRCGYYTTVKRLQHDDVERALPGDGPDFAMPCKAERERVAKQVMNS